MSLEFRRQHPKPPPLRPLRTILGAALLTDDIIHNTIDRGAKSVESFVGVNRRQAIYLNFAFTYTVKNAIDFAAVSNSVPISTTVASVLLVSNGIRTLIDSLMCGYLHSRISKNPTSDTFNPLSVLYSFARFGFLIGGVAKLMHGITIDNKIDVSSGIGRIGFMVGIYLATSSNGMFNKAIDYAKEAIVNFRALNSKKPAPLEISAQTTNQLS